MLHSTIQLYTNKTVEITAKHSTHNQINIKRQRIMKGYYLLIIPNDKSVLASL